MIKKIIKKLGLAAFIGLGIAMLIITVYGAIQQSYCKEHPSIWMDSPCFDVFKRCEWECSNYGAEWMGRVHGNCLCDCGEFDVSYCSGFKILRTE